jgi:hypothetical protein
MIADIPVANCSGQGSPGNDLEVSRKPLSQARGTRAELSGVPVRKWPGTRAEMAGLLCYNSFSLCLLSEERYMGSPLPPENEDWDLDRLRLPAELIGDVSARSRPPRHRSGDPFIKGPIPYAWIASACRLPGAGLHVAMSYRFYRGRFRFKRRGLRWGLPDVAKGLRISLRSARRGLHGAELAGLLAVEREPGCKLAVSILDLPGPESGPECRPLFGPIPWSWWLPASRLPAKSLHVGAACWLLAGWERSAGFELALEAWSDLGLSRFSASRGLDELESAKLISRGRSPGRSPVVTVLDVGDGTALS